MKNISRALSIVIFSVVLVITATVNASAAEVDDMDYTELFTQAQTVSPDEKREYVTTLNDAFIADEIAFLDALAQMDEDTLAEIVFLWMTGKTLDEIYALRDHVSECSTGLEYSAIVDELNNEIGVREHALMMEPYMQYEDFDAPFSIPILRRFIDLNIANETFDTNEEFNHMLAMAYESSPTIVAEIFSDYSQSEMEALAKCIAADYVKLGKSIPGVINDLSRAEYLDIINLIQEEITLALNPQPETESIMIEPPSADIMSTSVPTIGTMTYTTTPLVVGHNEVLSVTFSDSTNIPYLRQWYVEVYIVAINDSVTSDTLMKAQTVSISPGGITATINFNFSFTNPATFYTLVRVYSSKGGTLLTSELTTKADTVVGYWYINVNLPADRSQYGVLRLSNCNYSLLHTADCLGKSANDLPATEINGHTPTGTYTGVLRGPDGNTDKYGPHKFVDMDGVSGQIVDECSERDGILIHGGRSQTILSATDGCIRVFNADQEMIQDVIEDLICGGHMGRGYIYVSETSG